MRLLADLCIARLTILGLRAEGHDVLSLAEAKSNPSDREILTWAAKEERVVLTEDADFGELIFRDALAGAGVLRLEQVNPVNQLDLARRALALHAAPLLRGAIVTARRNRIRVTERS